ncbi:MAG TPA: nicotinate phosphoribosyltransferase [Oculatellaceae cyanobacterium]
MAAGVVDALLAGMEAGHDQSILANSSTGPKSILHLRRSGIRSILDNDLYKFTMQNAVRLLHPDVRVRYGFIDRRPKGNWTKAAVNKLKRKIQNMASLSLGEEERAKAQKKVPWLPLDYWIFLSAYRFDPNEVTVRLRKGRLHIEIEGLWMRTILWEVPLLALVSETYYEEIDTNWSHDGQDELMLEKSALLTKEGVLWGDFGTRRRRDFDSQERVVRICKDNPNFTGTSNVYLAIMYDVKALGTMAHEWIMAHSALFSLRHANRYALHAWNSVYHGDLGTALPDTFGTEAFLRDFDGVLARLFDSVRHDSGDAYEWAEKFIAHYGKLGIDWRTKPFGFTDGNTVESAIEIHKWIKAKGGRCWFGIGTSMTNDFGPESPALSIVIKLIEVTGKDGIAVPVVKLSDNPEKASGDPNAIEVAMWTHHGLPLGSSKKKRARTVH